MPAKILLIDDEPRNLIALSATLRARGYSCVSVGSAKEGIKALQDDNDIGLVLLDMMMPEMDGYEAMPLLHGVRDVPIIAVTARAMVGDKEACIAAGATDYLSKPVDVDKLVEMVRAYLGG
jgi:CheY-like chemotaxis protein